MGNWQTRPVNQVRLKELLTAPGSNPGHSLLQGINGVQAVMSLIAASKSCGSCVHWHKGPTNPANLAEVKGECREGPPQIVALNTPQGLAMMAQYPVLQPTFPACGRHEEKE